MAPQPVSQLQALLIQNRRWVRWMRAGGISLLKSWVLLLSIVFGIIVLAAVSVPLLTYLGLDALAKPLFSALHLICAQIPSHSFYLLGHQLGLDVHCLAIYSALCVGGLVFVVS